MITEEARKFTRNLKVIGLLFGPLAGMISLHGCDSTSAKPRLESLGLDAELRQALEHQRFMPLHLGDSVQALELILAGENERVVLAFSRPAMKAYLGIDAELLLPGLFSVANERELYLELDGPQLIQLKFPRGIGGSGAQPDGRVRELTGGVMHSRTLKIIDAVLGDGPDMAQAESISSAKTRRLGIQSYPSMGPRRGVVVMKLSAGGPAANAGMIKGDRILAVNGIPTPSLSKLRRVVANTRGATIILSIERAQLKQELKVDL